ncbi:MAG TPA: FtsJ-like methyltransferase family protein [Microlunatus sp.]|nr:FtsJ-like methyltransferase family protein [Microlunatus sp.]
MIKGADLRIGDVAAAARDGRLRFVRHLAAVTSRRPAAEADPESITALASAVVPDGGPIALQVWASGSAGVRPESLRAMIENRLVGAGRQIRRAGCRTVLGVCLGDRQVVVGLTRAPDALVDWPGGRVRLADAPEQISRAEHKLEELFQLHPINVQGDALDLGASPGGWTRILLRHGARRVHAVDPGEPAATLARRKDVVWHRTTAGEYLHRARRGFSLVVNDMRMEPQQSVRTMISAADVLRPGGVIIVTLKISTNRPVEQVDRALDHLSRVYKITFARQLHHNRNEVTVVGRLGRA